MVVIYGIKNCDTVKKAIKWLEARAVRYRFHDFRIDGIDRAILAGWARQVGWETLLNRRSTTWRQLPEAQKSITDETTAIEAMLNNPILIKRPVLAVHDDIVVGFNAETYNNKIELK